MAKTLGERAGGLLVSPPRITPLDVLAHKLPGGAPATVTKGLLLTISPRDGRQAEVEQFLRDGRAIVDEELETLAWFALALDHGGYAIFDVFPDNSGRFAHLAGRVPRELAKSALSLLAGLPEMDLLDVLAHKLC